MSEVEFYYNGEKAFGTYQYGVDYYFADDGRSYASSTTSASYASSATSDSAIAIEYMMKAYAEKLADRMADDNLASIDKDTIGEMIYAILMQEDEKKEKIEEFEDEDFLL